MTPPQPPPSTPDRSAKGFLTILGPSFLRRLYRRVARTPGSFLLVVEDGTDTVGFLAGSTDVSGLYRSFVLRDGVCRCVRLRRPAASLLAPGAWRPFATARAAPPTGAELLAVAVDPAVRGRGAGTLLVDGFLTGDRAAAAGRGSRRRGGGQRDRDRACTGGPDSGRRSGSSCIRAPSPF